MIALAKLRGLKTINLARDDATFAELTAAGADVVHVDDPDAVGDVRAVIGDARVALAVEAVGGPVVARLLELLSDGGWLVSYSWARDEPMWVDTSTLVGKHLTVRGFFVGDFDYRDKVVPVIREAAPLVADGALVVPVAGVYPPGHEGFDPWLRVKHLILPAMVVAFQGIAIYSRYMRASMLEVMNSDYMRTARSKGISEKRVIVRHGFRNALIPLVTYAALDLGAIVGGLVITEAIFEYPGMGSFFVDAYNNGDYTQILPWMMIVVFSVILFNLLADLAYGWLDPRIRVD